MIRSVSSTRFFWRRTSNVSLSINRFTLAVREIPSPENYLARCCTTLRDVISPILRCRSDRPPIWKRSIQLTVTARCNGAPGGGWCSCRIVALRTPPRREIVDSNRRQSVHIRGPRNEKGDVLAPRLARWRSVGWSGSKGSERTHDRWQREGCAVRGERWWRGDADAGRSEVSLANTRPVWFAACRSVDCSQIASNATGINLERRPLSPYTLTPRTSEREGGGKEGRREGRGDGLLSGFSIHPTILFPPRRNRSCSVLCWNSSVFSLHPASFRAWFWSATTSPFNHS